MGIIMAKRYPIGVWGPPKPLRLCGCSLGDGAGSALMSYFTKVFQPMALSFPAVQPDAGAASRKAVEMRPTVPPYYVMTNLTHRPAKVG